jgi:hypothetical protein
MTGHVENINWTGPRPLGDGDLLVGRGQDVTDAVNLCQTADIVRLTAPSGVGKTSFLQAGLVPALAAIGGKFLPEARPSWVEVVERGSDPATQYLAAIGARPDQSATDAFRTAITGPDGEQRGAPVVLLDQFEELLRYSPAAGADLLAYVAKIAQRTGVTHIVVARSEYLDQLRPLDLHGRPYPFALQQVRDRPALEQLVREPAAAAGIDVTDGTATLLAELWAKAEEYTRVRGRGWGTPTGVATDLVSGTSDLGLLHFQALLWSFKRWLLRNAPLREHIDTDDVRSLCEELTGTPLGEVVEPPAAAAIVAGSLREYVRRTVAELTDATTTDPDHEEARRTWPLGPRTMLARVAPHLSSAGYKVPQARSTLEYRGLVQDLSAAERSRLRRGVMSLEAVGDQLKLEPAGAAIRWERPSDPSVPPRAIPTSDVAAVMVASLRLALSSAARPDVNLLRAHPRGDDVVYELVHDGIGRSLEDWAEEVLLADVATVLGAITAETGQEITTNIDRSGSVASAASCPNVSLEHGRPVISNLRWTGCSIKNVTLQSVVFRECDFRGSWFEDCSIEDVDFIDCVFNGVGMLDTTIRNTVWRGEHLQCDGATLIGVDADEVRFERVRVSTGIFVRAATGRWEFAACDLQHASFSTTDDITVSLTDGTVIRHLTEEDGVEVDEQEGTDVIHRSGRPPSSDAEPSG